MYFSPNATDQIRGELCNALGFHSTPNFGKCLGFPLKQLGSSTRDFDFVIKRVQSKLAGWKGHLLSFVGIVVLTQAIISIPSYVMQNNLLPRRVLDSLDKVSRNSVWGSTLEKCKLHLVSWEKITRPKEEEGLGLQATKPKKSSLFG